MRKLFLLSSVLCLLSVSITGCGKSNENIAEQTEGSNIAISDSLKERALSEEIEFKSKEETLYTTTQLVAYQYPSEEADILCSYPYGSSVEVTGVSDAGWYRVNITTDNQSTEAYIFCTENNLSKELSNWENLDYNNVADADDLIEKQSAGKSATFTQQKPNYDTTVAKPKQIESK